MYNHKLNKTFNIKLENTLKIINFITQKIIFNLLITLIFRIIYNIKMYRYSKGYYDNMMIKCKLILFLII